jgi:hypothetical protein
MQFLRKIYSADIILQIAAQIWPQKVFDIKISTPAREVDQRGVHSNFAKNNRAERN